MDDRDVRLEAVLDWLEHGRITTEQAAARISKMEFPAEPDRTVHQEREADAIGDPEVPQPGSFFPVSAAHAEGRIDDAQYKALAQAAGKGDEGSRSGTGT